MKDLFVAECRRFRNLPIVGAIVHLMLLVLASRITEPLMQRWQPQSLFPLLHALAGLAPGGCGGLRLPTRSQESGARGQGW